MLVFGALVGAVGLAGAGFRSNAIDKAWGVPAGVGWYAMLLVFALFTLRAVYRPQLRRALELERIGMYGFGWTVMAYPPAVVATSGQAGTTAAVMFAGIGLATGLRIRHIHIDLGKLQEVIQHPPPPADPPVLGEPED